MMPVMWVMCKALCNKTGIICYLLKSVQSKGSLCYLVFAAGV